jgi:mannose-6-phosphate isomerase-like protein (cupin superfamily)
MIVQLGSGEGEKRFSARGSVMFFKAVAEQNGGDFSLMERTLPPGGRRPPPHRHTNCSEAYFVLDGLVSITAEDQELTVGPEGFVLIPRGTAHTFGNAASVRRGCWCSMHRRWTPISPGCTNCGTGTSHRPPMRNER